VLALVDGGASQGKTAEVVFGDRRYRGRVERILRSRDTTRTAPPQPTRTDSVEPEGDLPVGSRLATLQELVARYERSLSASDETPSLADIERLLKVKQRLEAWEMFERANALTRDPE
jgi:hypothetical protein